MSTDLDRYQSKDVTLAATCEQLTCGGKTSFKRLVVYESDVDFYVVVDPSTADGGALPATGRKGPFTPSDCPVELDVSPYGRVQVAGTGAGTAHCEAW